MTDTFRLKDSHLFLTSSTDVEEILTPLKEHFGVTSIVYQKNLNDGSEIRLSNRPDWVQHFYEQGYFNVSGFEKHPKNYQSSFVVWSHLSHHRPILEAARSFNIDHGMTLIQKATDGVEFYFIGTTPDKPYVTNLLLNNMEFLQRYTVYFKDQASHILKKAHSDRVIIPKKFETVASCEKGIPTQQNTLNLNKILRVKKIQLTNDLTLSEREVACAKLLLQGKSARLIGEELFLSPRTVETHLLHLKEKLNCASKSDLISKLIELNVHLL